MMRASRAKKSRNTAKKQKTSDEDPQKESKKKWKKSSAMRSRLALARQEDDSDELSLDPERKRRTRRKKSSSKQNNGLVKISAVKQRRLEEEEKLRIEIEKRTEKQLKKLMAKFSKGKKENWTGGGYQVGRLVARFVIWLVPIKSRRVRIMLAMSFWSIIGITSLIYYEYLLEQANATMDAGFVQIKAVGQTVQDGIQLLQPPQPAPVKRLYPHFPNAPFYACPGDYKGILHIQQGDLEGAFGTIFFMFVLNQLIYAEKYELLPFIHLSKVSKYVYDELAHSAEHQHRQKNHNMESSNNAESVSYKYTVRKRMQISWNRLYDPYVKTTYLYPGNPRPPVDGGGDEEQLDVVEEEFISGTGVWDSYFEEVGPHKLLLEDTDAASKAKVTIEDGKKILDMDSVNLFQDCPWMTMSTDQIVPGIHLFAPWAVRAWRYGGTAPILRQDNARLPAWYRPMRKRGNEMVRKYFHPKPHILELVDKAISPKGTKPKKKPSTDFFPTTHKCLAIHIRHSDKANKRRKIPIRIFLQYVEAYLLQSAQGKLNSTDITNFIYLATDSSRVISKIHAEWPPEIVRHLRYQENIMRSPNDTAVFNLQGGGNHHQANTEVLVDILAMAKCEWMVHGYSAVSEAAHYWSFPWLHDHSVNLDDKDHTTLESFTNQLRTKAAVS